ncbi:PEP-CTERM sorting domain-containing protein [Microcystis sp.]|jgi:hypothetical protein|uniref:PEP-CTERM sorting domain-containing protein n=2 Tax=Microcystis TaxID=1125 RepID=UPI00391895D3
MAIIYVKTGATGKGLGNSAFGSLAVAITTISTFSTLFSPMIAQAANITFNFEGVVDLSNIGGLNNTPLKGMLFFDSTLPNGSGNETISIERSSYGPFSLSFSVGGNPFSITTTSADVYGITIDNNRFGVDNYIVLVFDNLGFGNLLGRTVRDFRFILTDVSASMFTDTSLPLFTNFFSSVDSNFGSLGYTPISGEPSLSLLNITLLSTNTVSSPSVPEPSTILGIVTLGLGAVLSKKRNQDDNNDD